jgi:hypothetical protein
MKDQLKIQEMHNQSGKFGKPVKSIIDSLVDEAAEGGVESLQQCYQAVSELEKSGEAWVNLSGGK